MRIISPQSEEFVIIILMYDTQYPSYNINKLVFLVFLFFSLGASSEEKSCHQILTELIKSNYYEYSDGLADPIVKMLDRNDETKSGLDALLLEIDRGRYDHDVALGLPVDNILENFKLEKPLEYEKLMPLIQSEYRRFKGSLRTYINRSYLDSKRSISHPIFGIMKIDHRPKGKRGFITKEDRSLSEYGGNEHIPINAYLEGGMKEVELRTYKKNHSYNLKGELEHEELVPPMSEGKIIEAIRNIHIALRDVPQFKGVVYRNAYLPELQLKGLENGSVFLSKSFLSTSKLLLQSLGGGINPKLEKGLVNIHFKIISKTGHDLDDHFAKTISAHEIFEVIFLPDTKFTVLNKVRYGDKYYITMREN